MRTQILIKKISAYSVILLAILSMVYTFVKKAPEAKVPSQEFPVTFDSLNIEVLSGDENVIFVKLRFNDYSLIQAPERYLYRNLVHDKNFLTN